jgi:hypothetical protein
MNQINAAIELPIASRRVLRWRIPLLLALLANVGMLARMVFAPDQAVAASPTNAVASVATHRPSGNSLATEDATGVGMVSNPPATPAAELATPSPGVSGSEMHTNRTSDALVACLPSLPTETASGHEPAASANRLSTPQTQSATETSKLVPNWTELAANWWPAVELAGKNATRLVAAQPSQASTLTIENPPQNGVPVCFLVDARAYTLHPGESHMFPLGSAWDLQFHRGGAFGNTRESLSPGTYQFVVSAEGWTVQPKH